MANYRLCVIDAGCMVDVYEPDCRSDEEAYHIATGLVGNASIDIWQGEHWIACLDGNDPNRIALAHHITHSV